MPYSLNCGIQKVIFDNEFLTAGRKTCEYKYISDLKCKEAGKIIPGSISFNCKGKNYTFSYADPEKNSDVSKLVNYINKYPKESFVNEKDKKKLDRFGIDFESYSDEEIRTRNAQSAREIAASLAGSKLYSFGSVISSNANEAFIMELLRAQVEQNWILMRQNEEIIRLLKDIKAD